MFALRWRVALVVAGLAAVCGLSAPLAAQGRNPQNSAFDDARQRYEADVNRPALFIRNRSLERFAAIRDPRVIDIFAQRYRRPEAPADHVRYLLAAAAAENFDSAEHLTAFNRWAGQHQTDSDAWLWFLVQSLNAKHGQAEKVVNDAKSHRNEVLRAVSLEALAREQAATALKLVPEILGNLPRRGAGRVMLMESCASVLLHARHLLRSDDFRTAAMQVIALLGERQTEDRTKLVIARFLKIVFNVAQASTSPEFWLQLLNGAAQQNDPRYAVPQPSFIGVEATGKRVAFVIDLSDSMLIPLTPGEKDELRGVVTGGPGSAQPGNRPADNPGANLPWDSIRNRFDAAREFLKLALQNLSDDMEFTIIVFGTKAEPLKGSTGMLPANRNAIRAMIRELDAYRPGPQAPDRPHGTLMGHTNFHGGLLRAFQTAGRNRLITENEHVDANALLNGCDTIFVLSDGAPSWDDFEATDRRDPEDRAGDPEAGTMSGQLPPSLIYYGPYQDSRRLVRDLHRLNLLRKAEIHVVAIGEADLDLCRQVAEAGWGKVRHIGGGGGGGRGGRFGR